VMSPLASREPGGPTSRATPMFPLGTVLFPGMALPLHVFEPRYQALVRDCLAGASVFGVVLIERGSEVGGGDERFSVGTLARIREMWPLGDGRVGLLVSGEHRVRVERWLPDDPYPKAVLADLPDRPPPDGAAEGSGPPPEEALRAAARALRRALALAAEAGHSAPRAPSEEDVLEGFAADAEATTFRLAALVPAGPLDRQRLLEARSSLERLVLLERLALEAAEILALRLREG
jgi:Lon protease-like protein